MAVNVSGGALSFEALVASGQFQQQINNIEKSLQGLTRTAENEARSIDNLVAKTTASIAAYASVATASNFIGDIARVRGEFQQLEVAFTTMLGSKEKADKLMAQVTQFAATTPFELKDVATATKSLLAFNVAAEDIEPTLRSIGDLSAGIGAPIKEIAELFGKAKVQGRLFQEDINQLTGRGIPIIQELAKQFGVTEDKVRELVESGKVGFPNLQQAFTDLTAEGSKFGGLMAAQAQTITGLQSNLTDAITRMLNEIGQANEGIIASTIKGAISIVENYDKVIDVIKVLVITYGSYRAAIIATNAYQAIATSLTQGYTLAETLRYRAMLLSETAMKILNRTMLANPAVLVATGVAALVSALLIFNSTASKAEQVQQSLNEVQAESQKILLQEKGKLEDLLKVAKDETTSRELRLKAMRRINELYPETLGNLTLEKLKTNEGKQAIDDYIKALDRKAKAQAANAAIEKLYQQKIEEQSKVGTDENVSFLDALLSKGLNLTSGTAQGDAFLISKSAKNATEALDTIDAKIKGIKDAYKEDLTETLLGEDDKQAARARTVKVIEDEIATLKKQQADQSADRAKFLEFQTKIEAKEKELSVIRGASKSQIRDQQREETETNRLLEKRQNILQAIEDLKRSADQSGLIKEQSEIDKVNEKYDNAIQKVQDYNAEVDKLGKGQKIGAIEISTIETARNLELKNVDLKRQAELQKEALEEQKEIFERYEEAKKEFGIEKAREMFEGQTKGFESYSKLLLSEFAKLQPKILLGIGNIKDKEMFSFLLKAMSDVNKQVIVQQQQDYKDLLLATADFNDQRAALDEKYNTLYDTLEKQKTNISKEEYNRRHRALVQSQSEEETALKNSFAKQSDLYKKLGEELILFTRDDLKKRLDELKKIQTQGFFTDKSGKQNFLTPEMSKALQGAIDGTQDLLESTNETAISARKVAKELGKVRGALSAAAGLASQFDEGLAEALTTMTSLADAGIDVATAVGQFASGDIIGGIGSALSGVTKLASSLFGESPEERAFKERLRKIEFDNLNGEVAINELYRERAREQIRINELRLEGIRKEAELLKLQSKDIEDNYNEIFARLSKLKFTGTQAQVDEFLANNPNLNFLDKTLVKTFHLLPLLGKSFEDLEKLNTFGQLSGDAKVLFEQLQKLKNEGVDVNKALEDAKKEAQEILTGTTSDSILDSIVSGFENGLRSAEDFAGTFEDLMKKALLNSLKFKYLEGPLKKFFEDFAAASESNGELSNEEVKALNDKFNSIINAANQQFQQLQQVSGIDFSATSNNSNSLQGAIKTIQEETAQLLAGQMGGLRLTAIEQLNIAKTQLDKLEAIQFNTAATVARLETVNNTLINFFRVEGVKLA